LRLRQAAAKRKSIWGLIPLSSYGNYRLKKAKSVAAGHKNALIIAADTIGVMGERYWANRTQKMKLIRCCKEINGKSHLVITGFSILDTTTNKIVTGIVNTRVYIKKLTRQEIDAYVKTG